MPILKSALKRMRSDRKVRERNQAIARDLKTRIRKFHSLISQKKSKEINPALKELISKIDKAAVKGVIHKNRASRLASRLTKQARRSGAA